MFIFIYSSEITVQYFMGLYFFKKSEYRLLPADMIRIMERKYF